MISLGDVLCDDLSAERSMTYVPIPINRGEAIVVRPREIFMQPYCLIPNPEIIGNVNMGD